MREILFRGKTYDGEWVEGFYFREAGDFIKELPSAVTTPTRLVIPETVGQYTGLTDKNGKKIFEGDIVKRDFDKVIHIYWVNFDVELSAFIAQRNGGFCTLDDEFEIIGNIHDNPELLKGGAE